MTDSMISNSLLAVIIIILFLGLYQISVIVSILRASDKKTSVNDNNVTGDLRLEEKYRHIVKKDTKRKPIARSDVELWEQEKAELSKK